MSRAYYDDSIDDFLARSNTEVLGRLLQSSPHTVEPAQRDAWSEQMDILRLVLEHFRGQGRVLFEFSIPRLGKRIDVVLLIQHILFVIEFKVGERKFSGSATDQVWDYGLDLKNFHETTHNAAVLPILVATQAEPVPYTFTYSLQDDKLLRPIHVTPGALLDAIRAALRAVKGPIIAADSWESGRYHPTPTIVEAAMALYSGHSVEEISRRGADDDHLGQTSSAISEVIRDSRNTSKKSICFVTGVPGAGKTLVGLDIATKHVDKGSELYSVFLSGNDPEAIAQSVEAAGKMLKAAKTSFETAGYTVQTIRITTQPFEVVVRGMTREQHRRARHQ